ncbi:hypothetical protein BDV19DRAFT_395422 [Aspergillus venezuelensis]
MASAPSPLYAGLELAINMLVSFGTVGITGNLVQMACNITKPANVFVDTPNDRAGGLALAAASAAQPSGPRLCIRRLTRQFLGTLALLGVWSRYSLAGLCVELAELTSFAHRFVFRETSVLQTM